MTMLAIALLLASIPHQTEAPRAVERVQSLIPAIAIGGVVGPARLIHSVTPIYPPAALQAGITGTVTVEATIGKNGRVGRAEVQDGPRALRAVSLYAVRQWRWEPPLLNGKATERKTVVYLRFTLTKR